MIESNTPLSDIKILIVENDKKLAFLERDILTSFGFREIVVVYSGKEAIDLMYDTRFDILILDWEMSPMKGIDFIKFIRFDEESPDTFVPIIMVTGRAEREDVEIARDAGATEFIAKPFTVEDLRKRIISIIERPRKFVLAEEFHGHDRRRHRGEPPNGVERRKAERKKKGLWS